MLWSLRPQIIVILTCHVLVDCGAVLHTPARDGGHGCRPLCGHDGGTLQSPPPTSVAAGLGPNILILGAQHLSRSPSTTTFLHPPDWPSPFLGTPPLLSVTVL